MKLISWNINRRRETAQQMRVLAARRPDIIGLQEVTAHSVAGWVQALTAAGFHHVRATVTESSDVRRGPHASGDAHREPYPLDPNTVGLRSPLILRKWYQDAQRVEPEILLAQPH